MYITKIQPTYTSAIIPDKKTDRKISKPANNIVQITFTGQDKNSNQIAVLASECVPYSVSGGLGAVTRDMTKTYKQVYPNKDIRLFLPFYNSMKEDIKSDKYEVTDTGISTDFNYGVRKSQAKLYKIKNPESKVPTYLVRIPEFKNFDKQYDSDYYSLFEKYAAFSYAAMSLMEKMHTDKQEDFNPKVLHTKDWHTVYANFANDDKDLKKVHELLNANSNFHGKIHPLAAALNLFNDKQLDRLVTDDKFKRELYELTVNNKYTMLKGIKTDDLNEDINNPEFSKKLLSNLADNYTQIVYNTNNYYSGLELSKTIRNLFPEISWDEDMDFNPTVNAIKDTDAWFTISKTHFNELCSDASFSSNSLYNMLRVNLDKGTYVLNKIDTDRYNPENPQQVEYTYNKDSYQIGKQQNKDFLFREFSQNNIRTRYIDKKLLSDPKNAIILGYLDSKYSNCPLAVNISRFDTNQKGSDIALKAVEEVLKNNDDICFILGLPDITKLEPDLLNKFNREVINNPKIKGRVLLIDSYIPINQYIAGADFSIIPSRSETCGLVGYQSMRMGALPISTPVGSMNDCLITPEEDSKKAMGFKVPMHFSKSKNPDKLLANTIEKAKLIYQYEPELTDRMIKNAMMFDSDWKTAIPEQDKIYTNIIENKKMNNISLNEFRTVEDKVNIEMYHRGDIDKLPKSDVLIILPHSDDEIFFLPMLKYLNEGKSVQIVYLCANEKGHYKKGAPSSPKELSKHRENESLESLNELGIKQNPINLGIPDLELCKDNYTQITSDCLDEILEKVQPRKVLSFGPTGITFNPDHRKSGEIAFNCVSKYNKKHQNEYKYACLTQANLTHGDVYDFEDIMSGVPTDAFKYLFPVSRDDIFEKTDVSKYEKQIRKSLSKHQSQWSEAEADGLARFYTQNCPKMTSLDEYPKIDFYNPWEVSAKVDQYIYSDNPEFRKEGNQIVFQPKGMNTSINLYLANNGYDRKAIWIEDKMFDKDNVRISPNVAKEMFNSLDRIKAVERFSQVEYINLAIKESYYRLLLTMPFDDAKKFAPYVESYCQSPWTTFAQYRKENPDSKIFIHILD